MKNISARIRKLLDEDRRYPIGAYQFVQDALLFARSDLQLGETEPTDFGGEPVDPAEPTEEQHLTGRQLCEAARQFALAQYGLLARSVLDNWGIRSTGDIGEIVYNLIRIGCFKKSKRDRREDFDHVYDFEEAFRYELPSPKGSSS